MTQEEKSILLQDLCARLSYGVKVWYFDTIRELLGIIPSTENVMVGYDINDYEDSIIEDIKPYLRPMSSMTEEEKKELINIGPYLVNGNNIVIGVQCNSFVQISKLQEWLNKKMFAYRNIDGKDMFELGLALEAPEGMYK